MFIQTQQLRQWNASFQFCSFVFSADFDSNKYSFVKQRLFQLLQQRHRKRSSHSVPASMLLLWAGYCTGYALREQLCLWQPHKSVMLKDLSVKVKIVATQFLIKVKSNLQISIYMCIYIYIGFIVKNLFFNYHCTEKFSKLYLCGNLQNKPNGRFYGDVFNQMYILILLLYNTTINISTNTSFEQIMVDFSINWLYKVFHLANFGLGFKEIEIDFEQALWLANWHQKLTRDTEQ